MIGYIAEALRSVPSPDRSLATGIAPSAKRSCGVLYGKPFGTTAADPRPEARHVDL
jgi:hypothetical protein